MKNAGETELKLSLVVIEKEKVWKMQSRKEKDSPICSGLS